MSGVAGGAAGCLLAVLTLAAAGPAAAQNRRCLLEVLNVDRQGVYSNLGPASTNYFAGGNVHMRCRGEPVEIWSDSVASFQGQVVQFIGNFRYQDETRKLNSDFGTYYKNNEWWQATGNVVYQNTKDGSTLKGPVVNYYRKLKGTRDVEEVFAEQRPTLQLAAKDSLNRPTEPYVVVGDRVRSKGEDLMWAGGSVTIDRSDLRGRGDSLALDTGKASSGFLLGHASIRRAVSDSFVLAGKRIDLALTKRELTGVTGRDSATLVSKDLDLDAETIQLRLKSQRVVQTLAWGNLPRPKALADDFEVRGDSLAVDTPEEQLTELRSFRTAWVGFKPDTVKGDRDWLAGDTVVARFGRQASASGLKTVLRQIEARHGASSLYRIANERARPGRPTINYATAEQIRITMQPGDSTKVDRVEMTGDVHGMQLQPDSLPTPAKPDTSARKDTTAVRRKKP